MAKVVEAQADRTPPPLAPRPLLLATSSQAKLAELQAMAAPHGLQLHGLADARDGTGAALVEPAEDGTTFVDNAALKAIAAARATGGDALADDSGLVIAALGGAPGVHSARYAGLPRDDGRNLQAVLMAMAAVPDGARQAAFECALVLAGPLAEGPGALRSADGIAYRAVIGRVEGVITRAPQGDGGFGYDPIFEATELGCTFAEASAAQKATISHRGRAFAALLPLLTALRARQEAPAAPLFLRPLGLEALADALGHTLAQGLRYAVAALDQALQTRRGLGAHERAAVSALLHQALRRLTLLQRAAAVLGGATDKLERLPDPRALRAGEAPLLALLAVADVDETGTRLAHRAPGESSALRALLRRRPDLEAQLPAPAAALEKALRVAHRELAALPGIDGRAAAAGVHPDFIVALDAAFSSAAAGPNGGGTASLVEPLLEALQAPGPPTLRCRHASQRDTIAAAIAPLGVRCVAVPELPSALMLLESARVTTLPEFQAGDFEIQDAGSQRIAALVSATPGMAVADWCAGAGGKALALATAMALGEGSAPTGRLCAFDVHERRLTEARRRVARAGLTGRIEVRALPPTAEGDAALGLFDRVLVDAPCSSTGALRRTPELRWHLDAAWLGRMTTEQLAIALRASRRVRPGGWLIYATCSLLPAENEQVVARLQASLGWRVIRQERIGLADPAVLARGPLPQITGDGFFCAILERGDGEA